MLRTRIIAIAGAVALAAVTAAIYGVQRQLPARPTNPAELASANKEACFANARADQRNILVTNAQVTAFCGCVVDQSIAGMTEADLRQASINPAMISQSLRRTIAEANAACRPRLTG